MQNSLLYLPAICRSNSKNRGRFVVIIVHILNSFLRYMKKHVPSEEMKKDLDNLLSKLNAMEIIAKDEFQTNSVKVLRALVEGQIHSINEFDHLKKAIDLLTLELFKVQNQSTS